MSALGSFIQKLLDHITNLWPFVIIRPWEQGVRLLLGRINRLLTSDNGLFGTGLHWHYPIVGEVFSQDTVPAFFETLPQTVDRWTFTLGIQYEILDLCAYYARIHTHAENLANVVRTAATAVVDQGALNDEFAAKVLKLVRKRTRGWGIKWHRIVPLTITECQSLRLLMDRNEAPTIHIQE